MGALRRQIGKGNSNRDEAVVNTSLFNSDIRNIKRFIIREAIIAWEVGKMLAFSVKGDEREVVDEIMRLKGL
ncbi:hypothetical protein J1N35_018614 [Gossypium stocksii]|uniref:Uncharacterized protein n=1 Tax=Gossypium stocksii TaxID=47602 RepID=A0A9D4A548_9ROSI|nr:hypothetical protein J1N35_018614 [Gossypium stocksii]